MSGLPLEGKVVVVTGASSGIGRATALACSRQGARIVVAARKRRRARDARRRRARAGAARCASSRSTSPTTARWSALAATAPSRRSGGSTAGSTTPASTRSGASSRCRPRHSSACSPSISHAVVRGSRAALAQFRAQGSGVLDQRLVDGRRPAGPVRERVRHLEVGRPRPLARAARRGAGRGRHRRLHRAAVVDRHADLPPGGELQRPPDQGADADLLARGGGARDRRRCS